ncbi:MAG TPA: Bax inhibitor-1/YccA family protein [Candidatus Thermoplasmatota archaeon]|nr:Bax inhibitor-1/YccA family protein [Candidatus Thermoplasmatota archaeon]
MPSANPALNVRTFQGLYAREVGAATMTLEGTAKKAGVLTLCVAITAIYSWIQLSYGGSQYVMPLMLVGMIGGLVVAIVTIVKKSWSPVTAPLYALFEGLFLGVLSVIFEVIYPGIVFEAIVLTFSVLAVMLIVYATGLINPSQNLKLGIAAATGGIMVFYMFGVVMSLFGVRVPLIWDSGPFGVAFSLFVIGIAALNLVIDFDFIEQGAAQGAPKYMEWYAAFGLMVTLIWLYVEILRLLAKTRQH